MQKVTLYFITIVIGVVLVFIIGLGIGMYYLFNIATPTPTYLSQSCEYDLYIYTNFAGPGDVHINSSDNPVRNITMGIPLPHRNGRPLILEKELTPELFQQRSVERLKGNTTTPIERAPPFNYSFVVSNGTQMVMIQSAPGSTLNHFRMDFRERRELDDEIPLADLQKSLNTLVPLRNSTVFAPEECIPVTSSSCSYTLPVYFSYDTDPTTTMAISSAIHCSNDWAESPRWRWNSYTDRYGITIKGPAHGWYNASGTLEAGEGIYR